MAKIVSSVNQLLENFFRLFLQEGATRREIRSVTLLVITSMVGLVFLGSYAFFWSLHGVWELVYIDLGGLLLLLSNLYLLKRHTRYEINIYFGLTVFSLLLIMLFWNGSNEKPTYVWYFAYPGISAFLLGSRKAILPNSLVIVPVILIALELHPLLAHPGYSQGVLVRFISSYFFMGLLAYLLEGVSEKYRAGLDDLNRSLENTIAERTAELRSKNLILAEEVTHRREAEKAIALSLHEKEILLKEVYHRTKNNMNVIISLLHLQQQHTTRENMDHVFEQLTHRIHSMSAVHEKLYKSDNVATIALGEYVSDMTGSLRSALALDEDKIEVKLHSAAVDIGLTQAIPLGLALNEIISNAFKHGCKSNDILQLTIRITEEPAGRVTLYLADNGPGLPPDFDLLKSQTMGAQLIHILLEDQLQAQLKIDSNEGLSYEIGFDLENAQFPNDPV